jgi:hypothetical protein
MLCAATKQPWRKGWCGRVSGPCKAVIQRQSGDDLAKFDEGTVQMCQEFGGLCFAFLDKVTRLFRNPVLIPWLKPPLNQGFVLLSLLSHIERKEEHG